MNLKLPKELIEKFKNLGLSQNEIKVYLLLLYSGPLTAKEISEYSQVPFSKIYLVLNNLERKGWLNSSTTRPVKYSAKPPQEAVEIVKRNLEKSMNEAAEYIARELQPIYDRMSVSLQPNILLFYGESNIAMKMIDVILSTRRELLLALHHRLESFLEYSSRFSSIKLIQNRPRIKILVSKELIDDVYPLIDVGAEVRYRDEMFGGGAISDDREALIILEKDDRYSTALWSTHHSLIELAKSYFEKIWSTSKMVV